MKHQAINRQTGETIAVALTLKTLKALVLDKYEAGRGPFAWDHKMNGKTLATYEGGLSCGTVLPVVGAAYAAAPFPE